MFDKAKYVTDFTMKDEVKKEYTELQRIYNRIDNLRNEDEKLLEFLCQELKTQNEKIGLMIKREKMLQEQERVERVKELISKNKNLRG